MAENNPGWESILTKLQRDASECINIFEDPETARTWGEWTSDWFVWDRRMIGAMVASDLVIFAMIAYYKFHSSGKERDYQTVQFAKATKLYFKTLQSETEQLNSGEPDMGEDMRKRMAKRTAASSCKTFLKQSLDYSDYDAQKFIDDLQS